MPLFEYRCEACDAEFELLVRAAETPRCPQCQSARLSKLLSAPAGHVQGKNMSLPIAGGCPPQSAGPCGPGCCRLP
ncbi:MAG: zinc ribbon domain-containing protein [Planctomycetaceae bacterium]|nr:zinc ribbon domain-containing protein [Planctomycetaceae bacterium]